MRKLGAMKKVPHTRRYKVPVEKPLCSFIHRFCTRPRLDGYAYCITHIMLDKNAPFRQCAFVHPVSRKRCSNAAQKNDKRESICPWHIRQAQLAKIQPQKKSLPKTFASLLSKVEQYCEDSHHNPHYDPEKDRGGREKSQQSAVPSVPTDIKFMGSSVEGRSARLSEAWIGHSDESDSNLDESDNEDPLTHAGVYTYEEVARIYKDKLVQLQSLYMEQFKWLYYLLREKRRDYLHALRNEKKTHGGLHRAVIKKEDRTMYQKIKALHHYHHRSGQEAVLHKKYMLKRQVFREGRVKLPPKRDTCVFSDDGNKCKNEAVVYSKYCITHVLSDTHQVLFKRCSGGHGDCVKSVIPYTDNVMCTAHSCCLQSSAPPSEKDVEANDTSSPVAGSSGIRESQTDIMSQEPEHFQSMDDIASLGLDAVVPGSLFGLNQVRPCLETIIDENYCMTWEEPLTLSDFYDVSE